MTEQTPISDDPIIGDWQRLVAQMQSENSELFDKAFALAQTAINERNALAAQNEALREALAYIKSDDTCITLSHAKTKARAALASEPAPHGVNEELLQALKLAYGLFGAGHHEAWAAQARTALVNAGVLAPIKADAHRSKGD